MCRMKSAIILRDRVFMPNYDSHTDMLEELGIDDTGRRANFIRAEMYPDSGDMFEPIENWKFHVDQDYLPDWFVKEYDSQRMGKALDVWLTTRNGTYISKKEIGELTAGDTFLLGNIEYVVLDKSDTGVSTLAVSLINREKQFSSDNNNFDGSEMDQYLNNTYLKHLSKLVGEDNIVDHTVDLTSLDGLTDYEKCERKISLLTLDQYRKYRGVIPNADGWWYLSTPWSTPSGVGAGYVFCVNSDGRVDYRYFCCGGVRPFCIFKSSLLVSTK